MSPSLCDILTNWLAGYSCPGPQNTLHTHTHTLSLSLFGPLRCHGAVCQQQIGSLNSWQLMDVWFQSNWIMFCWNSTFVNFLFLTSDVSVRCDLKFLIQDLQNLVCDVTKHAVIQCQKMTFYLQKHKPQWSDNDEWCFFLVLFLEATSIERDEFKCFTMCWQFKTKIHIKANKSRQKRKY